MTELLTTAAAAKELAIGRSTLDRWAAENLVTPTAFSPDGHRRWDVDDIKRQCNAFHASRQSSAVKE